MSVFMIELGLVCVNLRPIINSSTDPGQAALANTTLGPASTLASDLHRLITVAHPQERPLGLVGSKRDEFVQRQQNQALAEDIC